MFLKTILTITMLFSTVSYATADADACGEVDLRLASCPNGQPRLPGLRNQGSTNYCFAFTLADYYSYMTCSDLSGFYAGLQTNLTSVAQNPHSDKVTGVPDSTSLNRGSSIERADELLRSAGGICSEQDFTSNRSELQGKSEDPLFAFFEQIWQRRTEPNVLACAPRALPAVTWNTLLNYSPAIRETIHEELTHNRPVPINYAGELMSNAQLESHAPPTHYVMIVGRKKIGGRCHYLVRDPTPVYETPWVLDNGYAWIPETQMLEQIREVSIAH